mgnify:CR=1 FL=1
MTKDYRSPTGIRAGLGGFWGDLWNLGRDELEDWDWQGGSNHIPAQQATQREFAAIEDWLLSGPQTVARIDTAIGRLNRAATSFFNFATQEQFGARGRRGAYEERAYADEAIRALQAQRQLIQGGDAAPWPADFAGVPTWLAVAGVGTIVVLAVRAAKK